MLNYRARILWSIALLPVLVLILTGRSLAARPTDTTPQPPAFEIIQTDWECSSVATDPTMQHCAAEGLFRDIGGPATALVTFTAPGYRGSSPPPSCSDLVSASQTQPTVRAACPFGVFASSVFVLAPHADVSIESRANVASATETHGATIDWVAIGAVATFITAAVALFIAAFGQWLQSLFFKPILAISIDMGPPDCTKIQLLYGTSRSGQPSYIDSFYVRLSVTNNGNREAQDVEVRLLKLWIMRAGGSVEDPDFLPLNLKWSHTGLITAARIQPKLSKHCDLCRVLGDEPSLVEFVTEVTPNPLRAGVWATKKPPADYRLDVAVAANNAKVVKKTVRITFAGWYPDEGDMFSKGLVVKVE